MDKTPMKTKTAGAEKIRWDLGCFYSSVNDPELNADLAKAVELIKQFNADYQGQLGEKLGRAITDYAEIEVLQGKIGSYLSLRKSLDTTDTEIQSKLAEVEKILSDVSGQYLTFFDIELTHLPQETVNELYRTDPVAARHRPWVEHTRLFAPHLLSEPVESALTKRSPFGSSAWSDFYDETESDLRFNFRNKKRTLTEMLHILTHSTDAEERQKALMVMSRGFEGAYGKYCAQTLYMIAGACEVERKERGYKHPMQIRNMVNHIPDEVVDTLHKAVANVAAPIAKRYYRLKAKHLGLPNLKWSDRNAPLPFSDKNIIPYRDAIDIVLAAYESFSPTLAGIIRETVKHNRIDAPAIKGKSSGAFNASSVLPDGKPVAFTLLNYLGANDDVMTLAHELGHGVHGILSGEAQGPLMFRPPLAYAETASVFGEMTTFNFLRAKLSENGDTESLLALIMQKLEAMINTMVRQISFSNFERRLHGMDAGYQTWGDVKKLSVKELDANWLKVTKEFYGEDGEVFTYENAEHLWMYISHFHSPFYVYCYAFGELLTNSLYATRAQLGDRFEPLYLDLLRAGDTKNATELLSPFGLDPEREDFWVRGIEVSLGALLKEAEELSARMGVHL